MLAVATKVVCVILSNCSWAIKAVLDSHPEPIIPGPLFRVVVTVMAKWLYIQQMVI